MPELYRLDDSFSRWDTLLALVMASFAYMDQRIDPPSSAHRLTPEALAEKARDEIGYVIADGDTLLACAFFRPEPPDFLYLGKLAVSPAAQGKGLGKLLLAAAMDTARQLSLPKLRLETRIELVENHATFAAWGFVKTAENRHAGFDRTTSIEMQRPVA
ncbi:GNAT family N-acetyltransferase [Rhizobium sp. PAMB 3174]